MVYSLLTAAFSAFALFNSATSVPIDEFSGLDDTARSILKRATPAAPHFVIYSDKWVSGETGPPNVTEIAGYNVFALSFLEAYGSADQAQEWQELTADQRTTIKAQYAAADILLIASVFGSTETPTSSGYDPIDTANTVAAWIIEYDLDGLDIDYEDFDAFDAGTGAAEQWLGNFTTQLRTQLPQGQYLLTHAPVAPWFSPGIWGGGGYLLVDQTVGSMIDWYNVQFYNQGTDEYTTCDGLLNNSSSTWPESALFQIAASGVSLDKLVIGKPATTADANNGYMNTTLLAQCAEEAVTSGYNGGIMVWQFPDAAASWIEAVRALAWPLS
ncbi:glycoside hydrolase family 18 protein [Serpula lacrymans var. lacrymans S7.3]|uniref:Glycoside hydrolase family 18 protein n=2 Tax=Serpula lacrymans var. lacrymans TaxID=341189 RepID=F8Q3E6_SERL3|nr:glycoside hydrolase family 18 protein [Serpula lacrymans var. lacrymans S7.9]EGN97707.1 glycoside hydrolase family 18 protein [Serpula lacrymans var. lacrymans S7.3]EGO23298.1 glycoside hydrolase family 18 protein [Serpula lacrymans var. lacrymans S7.9]